MNFPREDLAQQAASLGAQGVYIGTFSWKYPGGCGTLYDRSRHEYRGKFAQTRFNRDCLREYGEGRSESERKYWRQNADDLCSPSGSRLCRTAGRL